MNRLTWIIPAAALALTSACGRSEATPPKAAGSGTPGGAPAEAIACSGSPPAAELVAVRPPADGAAAERPAPHLCGLKPPAAPAPWGGERATPTARP